MIYRPLFQNSGRSQRIRKGREKILEIITICFTAEIKKHVLDEFILFAQDFIKWESASGSDPGLCIAIESRIKSPDRLMDFGKSAKQRVLEKEDAYELAREVDVHLSEHGGTVQGIIGSLAAVGLRMTGNDGRFKGHFRIKTSMWVIYSGLVITAGTGNGPWIHFFV